MGERKPNQGAFARLVLILAIIRAIFSISSIRPSCSSARFTWPVSASCSFTICVCRCAFSHSTTKESWRYGIS